MKTCYEGCRRSDARCTKKVRCKIGVVAEVESVHAVRGDEMSKVTSRWNSRAGRKTVETREGIDVEG